MPLFLLCTISPSSILSCRWAKDCDCGAEVGVMSPSTDSIVHSIVLSIWRYLSHALLPLFDLMAVVCLVFVVWMYTFSRSRSRRTLGIGMVERLSTVAEQSVRSKPSKLGPTKDQEIKFKLSVKRYHMGLIWKIDRDVYN